MRDTTNSVLLITLSGHDHPGITSEITQVLARYPVTIIDITQAVIQNILSLSISFEFPLKKKLAILQDLANVAQEKDLELQTQILTGDAATIRPRLKQKNNYAVTLIAEQVSARALHEVTRFLAQWKLNIDVMKRLSEGQFSCVEMVVSSEQQIDERNIRKELLGIAREQSVDIALQAEGLYRRAKRLVVLDMDSTLIQSEVIDELALEKGVHKEVAEITHQAMMGKLDFDESLTRRCAKLEGLPLEGLEKVLQRVQITPGAQDLICVLKKLGYKIALISGGFHFVAERMKDKLGIDFVYANSLDVKNGVLTGKVIPPIINAQRKADLLDVIAQQERIALDQVIAIGDGANDLLMLEKAGLGIAFNAKPLVSENADLAYSQKNMRSILYLLGLTGRDITQIIEARSTHY